MKLLYLLLLITSVFISCNEKSNQKNEVTMTNSTFQAKNISISIESPKDSVYHFASNPENLPKWLAFMKAISKKSPLVWVAETDLGKIEIEFVPKNIYGVLDHTITLPDGTIINNTLRIVENGKGSEVIFTLFKMPGKTNEEFESDASLVSADLTTLKNILESGNNN